MLLVDIQNRILRGNHIPIEDSAAEGTGAARSAEEEIPDSVTEGGSLVRRGEASSTGSATERYGHDLALGLAGLNVRGDEGAVGKVRAREHRVSRSAANLCKDISTPSLQSALDGAWLNETYVREIKRWKASRIEEDVQECEWECINRVVLCIQKIVS